MEIYLLRHGIAGDAKAGMPDADRALTDEGKKKLRAVLGVAKAAGVAPDLILTSPLKRAAETAKMAAQALGCGQEPVPTPALAPDGEPETIWEEIRGRRDSKQLLLAGHEPLLSCLAAYLLGGPASMIDVKKGALVRIDVEALGPRPRGVLRWLLTPRLAAASPS